MLIHRAKKIAAEDLDIWRLEEWLIDERLTELGLTGEKAEEFKKTAASYIKKCKKENKFFKKLSAHDLESRRGMIHVPLSPIEVRLADTIGNERYTRSREAGMKDMMQDNPANTMANEKTGAAAELAYAIRHDIYPYETMFSDPHATELDKGDYVHLLSPEEFHVDVKGTRYSSGQIFVGLHKLPGHAANPSKAKSIFEDKIHAICLFVGDLRNSNVMKFCGYIATHDLLNREPRKLTANHTGKPCYCAKQDELETDMRVVYNKFLKSRTSSN